MTNLQETSINTSVHVQLSSPRAVHKTDPSCSPAGIQHATCQASQVSRHNCSQHGKSSSPQKSARQALRHVHLRKSRRQPLATIPQYHDMSSVPRTRQLSHETSLNFLPIKHVCTKHKKALLSQNGYGHAEVLVRRETSLMKMWQVECLLVS